MTRILHIADLHFGAEDPGLVESFVETANRLAPDLIVAAGDFTQAARKREFDAAAGFFRRLDAPVVGAPGNHDVPVYALGERLMRPWRRFRRRLDGTVVPDWTNGRVAVASFLTARRAQAQLDWSLGRVSASALEDAMSVLEATDAPVRVLTCHHPLIAPGGETGRAKTRRGGDAAHRLAHSCDLVLTGHLHEAFILPAPVEDGRCWFIGAGTTFSHRTRETPPGFNQIDIGETEAAVTVWRADTGDDFEPDDAERLALAGR